MNNTKTLMRGKLRLRVYKNEELSQGGYVVYGLVFVYCLNVNSVAALITEVMAWHAWNKTKDVNKACQKLT